jgi:hypothetical protein
MVKNITDYFELYSILDKRNVEAIINGKRDGGETVLEEVLIREVWGWRPILPEEFEDYGTSLEELEERAKAIKD